MIGGQFKKKKIDHRQNENKMNKIIAICKKGKCMDIFRDAFIKNENEVYDMERIQRLTKYKFEILTKQNMYNKLSLMIGLSIFGGQLYLYCINKKI